MSIEMLDWLSFASTWWFPWIAGAVIFIPAGMTLNARWRRFESEKRFADALKREVQQLRLELEQIRDG